MKTKPANIVKVVADGIIEVFSPELFLFVLIFKLFVLLHITILIMMFLPCL